MPRETILDNGSAKATIDSTENRHFESVTLQIDFTYAVRDDVINVFSQVLRGAHVGDFLRHGNERSLINRLERAVGRNDQEDLVEEPLYSIQLILGIGDLRANTLELLCGRRDMNSVHEVVASDLDSSMTYQAKAQLKTNLTNAFRDGVNGCRALRA